MMAASIRWQLLEVLLTPSRIAIAFLACTVGSFVVDFTWKPRYPSSLPRIGFGGGVIGNIRNWIGYVTHFNSWVEEGYEKVSCRKTANAWHSAVVPEYIANPRCAIPQYTRHDRAYVVPSAPSRPQEIVIPRSQTSWLLEFPDHIVSSQEAHAEMLHGDYQFLGTDNQLPNTAVHKHLARNLVGLIPGIQQDVHESIDATFGLDADNWKTLNLWEALLGIVPRVTNRILVGEAACKNQAFLDSQVAFADTFVRNSFVLSMFPKIVHPIIAPLIVAPNWWTWRRSFGMIRPLIERRLHDMARKAAGDAEYDAWQPEECLVTWLIRQAQAEGRADGLQAATISKCLLPVEFAALHTTVMTGHSLLLDLLSADPTQNCLEILREEASRVFASQNGRWTKSSLSRLHRTDSAIRESLRLSHFATSLTHRKIVAKEGIINEKEGWHAPYGAYLMLDLAGTHHDPDLYQDPHTYDPLRFARIREEFEARPEGERDAGETLKIKRLGMVTTSETYLPFSHGRHAW